MLYAVLRLTRNKIQTSMGFKLELSDAVYIKQV